MKIAILGGGGCFALNFASACHHAVIDHFGIGRSTPKAAPFWQAPPGYQYSIADIVEHDFIVRQTLDRERPDIVVNFAAQGEGAASFGENAPDFFLTNTFGLARIVEHLRHADYLQQFIQISTSELYGSTVLPAVETDRLFPSSPYALSKAAFDEHLAIMHRIHGFPMTIIRPSNCYCPGQQLHRVIPKAIVCARASRKLPLEGGGKAQKSYLHADDLSAAILHIIDSREIAIGHTYNVGPSQAISIRDLVQKVAAACGVAFNDLVDVVPDRVGQDARYLLNSRQIKNDTGWMQTVPLEDGLADMVRWVDSYPEMLDMSTDYVHRP